MMKPALELQQKGETFLFIANYHALTTVTDGKVLKEATTDVALDFLACGLDPEKTCFFRQSDVPEVTELSWLLSVVTPMGLLERCHSYKDKVAKGIAPSHGLFAYPVLMAADILAYQSNVVPVGKDQKQHVEVARDISIKFNNQYGKAVFTIPEPAIKDSVAVVPGIDGQKMSKSYNNHIELFGSEKETKARIMRIVTDSKGQNDPKDPDTSTIFALYKQFATDEELKTMASRFRAPGFGYGDGKKALFEKMWSCFESFRKRRADLQNDMAYVEAVLQKGAEKARIEAEKTLKSAREVMGLE